MNFIPLLILFTTLLIIVLAAQKIGFWFGKIKLPYISGFLITGIIAGPFVLQLVQSDEVHSFLPLNELALAFIAFAAGAELELHIIRGFLKSIVSIITGQVVVVFTMGLIAFLSIQKFVPFMADLPAGQVIAIALLGATIMLARSPSSALAIIKEMRARGPFTQKILGATILKDAIVILIFAATVSISAVLVEGVAFNAGILLFVVFEILLDLILGIAIGGLLRIASAQSNHYLKMGLILLIGYGVFALSTILNDFHIFNLAIFSEPLLICMTAGFVVSNYTKLGPDFQHTLEEMSPAIFVLFFTLVGIELELDVIGEAWVIILFLFTVRFIGVFVGSYAGAKAARDPGPGNLILGLGFITQAGVSIGLAKEIGVEFHEWGPELATLLIGVVVLNDIVGPPLFKWAINHVGESHTRAAKPEFDGVRDAIIFGIEGQSLALARQLESHDWNTLLVTHNQDSLAKIDEESRPVKYLSEITLPTLHEINMDKADGVVLLLSDQENYAICELIYENFGIDNVVVRLQDNANFEKFHELGALVVAPDTAMVSLLDQFLRSPDAASILLGMHEDEEFLEIELTNPDFNNLAIRDIHLPHDVLIFSIMRRGERLDPQGYTRLKVGDHITVVGSPDSIAEVEVRFEV